MEECQTLTVSKNAVILTQDMDRKLTKVVAMALLGLLLVTMPGLAGCSRAEASTREIIVGFLDDLTGAGSFAIKQGYQGMQDYFRMIEEEDPIPGAKIKLINYDTRLDYGRVPAGYVWLKGQGTQLFIIATSSTQEIVAANFEEDKIPSFGLQSSPALLGKDWVFDFAPAWTWEADCIMQYIWDTWEHDEMSGVPIVGHIGVKGWVGPTLVMERLEELHALYPDKFELRDELAPWGAMTWVSEVSRLMDCDFIIPTVYGPQMVSFLKEARERGYEGQFVSTSAVMIAFWDLVRASIPLEDVDGTLSLSAWPYWTDDVPFLDQCRERLLTYRPDEAEFHLRQTGWMTGQAIAMIVADAIRTAVEEVGADNVDGPALRDGLAKVNITVEGWGSHPWQFTEDRNVLLPELRMYEYRAAEDSWFAVTDWYLPLSLAGQ